MLTAIIVNWLTQYSGLKLWGRAKFLMYYRKSEKLGPFKSWMIMLLHRTEHIILHNMMEKACLLSPVR